MKKTLTIILLLLCAAISVQAQVSYGISVCGKEVTSDNSSNVLGDGKVSYRNGTLMLMAGADLTVTGPNYGIEVEERYERSDLNIYLMGDATISSYADCIHLSKDVKVTFMGSKTLTLYSTAANGIYAEGEGDILFTMGITVNCIVKNVGFYHNPKEKGLLRFAEMKTSTIYGEGGAVIGFEDVAFMANYLKDDYYTYDKVNRVMLDNRKQTAQRVNVAYGYGVTINGIDLTPENVGTLSKVFSYEEGDGLSTSPQLTIHDTATLIALSEAPLIELHRNCDEFIIHIDGDVKIDGKDKSSYFILSKGECSLQIAGTRNNTLTVTGFKNGIQHCYDDAMLNMNNQKPFDCRLCIRKLFMNMDLAGQGDGITTAAYIYFDTCNLNITKCKHHAVWAKSYAYDEAEIILPARAMINGGCVMEADFHTPAKNVSISSEESYGVVIGETPITYKNYNDVFGDGTVKYDPYTHTLKLTNALVGGISSYDKLNILCTGYNEIASDDVAYYNSTDCGPDEYATNIDFTSENASLNIIGRGHEAIVAQRGGLRIGPEGTLDIKTTWDGIYGGEGRNNKLLLDGANVQINFTDWEEKEWRSWVTMFDDVVFQNCSVKEPQGAYYDTYRKFMLTKEGVTKNTQLIIGYREDNILTVGGVSVDVSKRNDIFGDGTAVFDPETKTLKLTDATLNGGVETDMKLNIDLEGENYIGGQEAVAIASGYNWDNAIEDDGPGLTIFSTSGTGKLDIVNMPQTNDAEDFEWGAIEVANTNVFVYDCTLNVQSNTAGFCSLGSGRTLTINNAFITVESESAINGFENVVLTKCKYVVPLSARYDSDYCQLLTAFGDLARRMVIAKSSLDLDVTAEQITYNQAPNYDWYYRFASSDEDLEFCFDIPYQPQAGITYEQTFSLEDMDPQKSYLKNTQTGAITSYAYVEFTAYEGVGCTYYDVVVVTTDGNCYMFTCVAYDKDDELATGITAPSLSHDGAAYNLNGQHVGNGYKGIRIMNGRKYIK